MLRRLRSFRRWASIVAAVFVCAAHACADAPRASLALTTFVGARMYRLSVTSLPQGPFRSKLQILCVFGCRSKSDLVEQIRGSSILGAYPIKDGILTLWAVGDGDLVRVYHISDLGITKVLETPTRGQYPVLTSTNGGQPAIIIQGKTAGDLLRDQQQGVTEPTYPVQGDLWVWNGKKYVISNRQRRQ